MITARRAVCSVVCLITLFLSNGCSINNAIRGISLNEGWRFAKGDIPGAEATNFDDSSWRTVELPHDWSIEGPYDAKWAAATAFLPAGVAWYREHLDGHLVFPVVGDDRLLVNFDGVYKDSTVYLNGHKVGERPYGYSSFEYNLTPYLNPDGHDVLAVKVDHHDFADSRWYPGSGIYRNVSLTFAKPVRVDRYGTFVTTPQVSERSATVNIETTIRNDSASGQYVDVVTHVLDPDRHEVAAYNTHLIYVAGANKATFKQTLNIVHPVRWSVDHPVLYSAVTEVTKSLQIITFGDPIIDNYSTPFGIREIKFDPNTGFSLNGQSLKLKGVCLHEDAGALGSAIPRQVWERRLTVLKEAGCNAIRCSHNPPDPVFLDLCDRMGFLVMDEAFDEWSTPKRKWVDRYNGRQFSTDGYHTVFAEWSDRDLQDMVLRDRNHPSIIMWSIGNEIDYPNDPYPENSPIPVEIATRLIKDVKALDTSRPVTAACASIRTNLYYPQLDVVGYNYQENRYAADHAQNPQRVIYGSENKDSLEAWQAVEDNPFICAQYLWTGIDYMGEAHAFPAHASPDGFIDLAGFPKPSYYFRQSLWNDKPMVHIEPSARGFTCNTNCESVEFFQNGKSLGEKPLPAATRVIDVPAFDASLPLLAVGKKNGAQVAEDTYTPAGEAAKIALSEAKTVLGPGYGPNVAQIEVAVTDAAGVHVAQANPEVAFTISGAGKLLAIENGDISSIEDPQGFSHKAFNGRMILYIQTQGAVNLSAHADGLADGTIRVGN